MFSAWKIIAAVLFVTCGYCSAFSQNDDRWVTVDDFGRVSNDELMSRVDRFHDALDKRDDAIALVVLYGPRTTQYLNQRRIEGCSRWRKRTPNRFRFVFGPEENPMQLEVKFLLVAKDANITITEPDYKLPDLTKPLELSRAFSTDEYCPRYFDPEWFSHFMNANPHFRGKVVIDCTRNEFVLRVTKYRKELKNLGVVPSRISFSRRHFHHERDEQWWLMPTKHK